jgi:hypothetical protein
MATIETKQFNWLPTTSAWESMKNWREKHRAYQEQADTAFAASAEIFSAATANFGLGMGEIAAKQAAAGVSAAVQEKISSVDVTA